MTTSRQDDGRAASSAGGGAPASTETQTVSGGSETSTATTASTVAATSTMAPAASGDPLTIAYEYDPLNRLTKAAYSNGMTYKYTYDAVGNRLSQTTTISGQSSVISYQYDDANRLASVGGVPYTYDANGNLLFNGVTTYNYDSANRLISASNALGTTIYAYNGLGERLQMTYTPAGQAATTTTFTMDLNSGLSQVLDDGAHAYLYGAGRIAQVSATDTQYFLGDALSSVRQLTDATGAVTLTKTYDPYGNVAMTSGNGSSGYGFTGEQQDSTGMVYLRSRYYSAGTGRFMSRDTWSGNSNQPMSYNRWMYTYGNPVNLSDPSGMRPAEPEDPDSTVYKYCYPLSGKDSLDCQKILLGLDPDDPRSQLGLILYQVNGECSSDPLYSSLPHILGLGLGTFREYGWWWHYLMEKSSGPWKRGAHVYIKDVIAYALSAELATHSDVQYSLGNVGEFVAEAFARKAWSPEFGFYKMLGSRQSVMKRVENAIYGPGTGNRPYLIYTDVAFQAGLGRFQTDLQNDEIIYDIGRAKTLAGYVISRVDWHNGSQDDKPYEWGNPTVNSPAKLKDVLSASNIGWLPKNVLYTSGGWNISTADIYSLFFVVTKEQMTTHCGQLSCVTGQ